MEKNFHSNDSGSWASGLGKDSTSQSDFYSQERQIGKAVEMISFALKSGVKRAFPSTLFDEISFAPDSGIFLYSRMVTIHIAGRHLDELYQSLTRRRVREIREFSEQAPDESALIVSAISIHSDYDRQ